MAFGWSEDSLWAGNRRVFFSGMWEIKDFFLSMQSAFFPFWRLFLEDWRFILSTSAIISPILAILANKKTISR